MKTLKTLLFTFVMTLNFAQANTVTNADILKLLKNRPAACPMKTKTESLSVLFTKLSQNLEQFKNKCQNSNAETINRVRGSLNELGTATQGNNAGILNNGNLGQLDFALGGLEQVSLIGSCENALESRSFLETSADTISSITRLGILTEDGIDIFIGGAIVSTLLRIIDSIFRKAHNWKNPEDRALFVKLNCSFYDIRQEIEKLGILRPGNEKTRQREKEITELMTNLDKLIKDSEELIKTTQENQKDAEKAFYSKYTEPEFDEFSDLSKGLQSDLASFKENNKIANIIKLNFVLPLYEEAYDLSKSNLSSSLRSYEELIREIFETYNHNSTASNKTDLSDERVLTDAFLLDAFSSQVINENTEFNSVLDKTWAEKVSNEFTPVIKAAEKVISDSQKSKDENIGTLALVQFRNKQGTYDYTADGTDVFINLQQTYNKTVNEIYGSVGHSFVSDIKRFFNDDLEMFENQYSKWALNNYDGRGELDTIILDRACTKATFLVERWTEAYNWSKFAYDFSITNLKIFHDFDDYGLLGNDSDNLSLRKDAYSSIYAQILVDKFLANPFDIVSAAEGIQIPYKSKVKKDGVQQEYFDLMERRSLGRKMVFLTSWTEEKERLENFINNRCQILNPVEVLQ